MACWCSASSISARRARRSVSRGCRQRGLRVYRGVPAGALDAEDGRFHVYRVPGRVRRGHRADHLPQDLAARALEQAASQARVPADGQ